MLERVALTRVMPVFKITMDTYVHALTHENREAQNNIPILVSWPFNLIDC
jgi:hypothetical protein